MLQADHANEVAIATVLDHPLAEAVLQAVATDALRQCVAFRPAQAGREVAHYLRVGIERGEGRQVFVAPGAQVQALGNEFDRGHGRVS
ncbi:hypothetical protein D3C78_1627320 [compost metagenome]